MSTATIVGTGIRFPETVEMEDFRRVPIAVTLFCNGLECAGRAVYEKEVPYEMAWYVEEYQVEELGRQRFGSLDELIGFARKMAEHIDNPVVIVRGKERIVVDGDGVVGCVAEGAGGCTTVTGMRRLVKIGDKPYTVVIDYNHLRSWHRDYTEDSEVWLYTPRHPLVVMLATIFRDYIPVRSVEKTFMESGVKGVFFDEYGTPTINVVYVEQSVLSTALDLATADDVAEDFIHTCLHEYLHFLDEANGVKYEGGWSGETPIQAWISFITGKPIPAGEEKTAEEFAGTLMKALREIDPLVLKKATIKVHRMAESMYDYDVIKDLRKVIDEIEDWREVAGMELYLDEKHNELAIEVTVDANEVKTPEIEKIRREVEERMERGEEIRDLLDKKETIASRYVVEKIRKTLRKYGIEDEVTVDVEPTGGGFVTVYKPVIRTEYDVGELVYEADITPSEY